MPQAHACGFYGETMSYSTLDGLKAHLGADVYRQVTDRTQARLADDAVGQSVLDAADALIDGKLAVRFAVPITDAAAVAALQPHALRIAAYLAFAANALVATRAAVRRDYEASLAWLERVAEGTETLPGEAIAPSTSGGGVVSGGGLERVWGREESQGLH